MPVINITLWKGRTKEQKAQFAKVITKEMVNILNTTEEAIQVIYHEIEKENWVIGGKILE